MPVHYVLRLDDICETMDWEKVTRIMSFASEHSIRPLLGVIPMNLDTDFDHYPRRHDAWKRIAEWNRAGAEIALHGYQHIRVTADRGLFGPFAASEFAGTPLADQRRRLELGYQALRERGLEPCAFMAPFHSLDADTLAALRLETPIRIVTDGVALWPYRLDQMTFVPSMPSAVIPIGVRTLVLHANTTSEDALDQALAWIEPRCKQFVPLTEAALSVVHGAADLGSRAGGRSVQVASGVRSRLRSGPLGR
jgi:hypothetical protein